MLQQSRCDWIFVLDADELLDQDGAQKLKALIHQPGRAAYDIVRWNYVLETNSRSGEEGALPNPHVLPESRHYPAYVKSINKRLFRRHSVVFFERPVHETVILRLHAWGLTVGTASFVIHHFGQAEDRREERARKNELYHEIGVQHLKANPNDVRTCFELGLG